MTTKYYTAYQVIGEYLGRVFNEYYDKLDCNLEQLQKHVSPIFQDRHIGLGAGTINTLLSDIKRGKGYKFLPHDLRKYSSPLFINRLNRLSIVYCVIGVPEEHKVHDMLRLYYELDYQYPPLAIIKPKIDIKVIKPVKIRKPLPEQRIRVDGDTTTIDNLVFKNV